MISQILSRYGYYGFLILGAFSMLLLMQWRRKIYGFSIIAATCFPLILLICGVAGAKLLFFIESGFKSFSGMSFFGAVFLVLLGMPLIGLLFRLKPFQTLDACAPCVASIIGFMRFGCFCAGCCGGIECVMGKQSFRWPTQLMEGFGDIFILGILLHLERRWEKKGRLYPTFLITYGGIRFIIEFLRETPKNMLGFSEGQWLALVGIIIGTSCLIVNRKKALMNNPHTIDNTVKYYEKN